MVRRGLKKYVQNLRRLRENKHIVNNNYNTITLGFSTKIYTNEPEKKKKEKERKEKEKTFIQIKNI